MLELNVSGIGVTGTYYIRKVVKKQFYFFNKTIDYRVPVDEHQKLNKRKTDRLT
jgi:hypothetical protein